jgi:predicted peroxiredoxin/TusA-related sulfurtransferase
MSQQATTTSPRPARSIDTRPLTITTAIAYEADTALRELADGEVLELTTAEYAPIERDLRAWCRMSGNRYVATTHEPRAQRHLIEKRPAAERRQELAYVISVAGLLELLSPLGFAVAAALEGIKVSIYFQGPAVKVLERRFQARLPGLARPFSVFPRRGLAKIGHAHPHEKLRQLQDLDAVFYACGPSMEHFRVAEKDLAFDGVIVAEYLTFMEVMSGADVQLFV